MNPSLAAIFMRGSTNDWYFFSFLAACFANAISIADRYWRFFSQWLGGVRGRDWSTVSAVIDVISVVQQTEQTDYGERVVGYLATLTYFYRNPELQMGEYSRMFDKEDDGQAWVTPYKGRAVLVHVDPRDPTNSVLRKEEL